MPVSAQLRQAVIARSTATFNAALDNLMADLRDGAPEASGATRRGLRRTPMGSPPVLAATVESTTPQGEWVEEGTRPHLILPRHGTVLVFDGASGPVFSRFVNHPGTEPRRWFRPFVDRWPQYLAGAAR